MSNRNTTNQNTVDYFFKSIQNKRFSQIKYSINNVMQPIDLSRMLQNTPATQRNIIWSLLDTKNRTEILPLLESSLAAHYAQHMKADELLQLLHELDDDDMADFASNLPNSLLEEIINKMSDQDQQRLGHMLSWPEDSAGGIMDTDMITIPADISVDVVWRYMRRIKKNVSADTDTLFIVDESNRLIGLLPLTLLLTNKPNILVSNIMLKPKHTFNATQKVKEVAKSFEKYDLLSAPVLDENLVPVGRITIDDVVDIIREEAEHSVRSMALLNDHESLFGSLWKSVRGRATWLGINLFTALLASLVIAQFQVALDKIVILAVLMPIIASMGGIATTQSFTLVVRAMALGDIPKSHLKDLILREFSIGMSNGILWASILGGIVALWFGNSEVAGIMAFALMINLTVACVVGAMLPFILNMLNIDVALAGGVILTTITDICGYVFFLGTATFLLL